MADSARDFEVSSIVPALETNRPANELSYEQLQHGVVFKSDIGMDFRLEDPDLEEEEYFEAGVDEEDLAWSVADPNKAVPTIRHLRERPKPLRKILEEASNLTNDGGVKKKIIESGSGGNFPPPKSKVYFHYSAWTDEGPENFDTSLGRSAESLITGETHDIIQGLRIAVESMRLHEVSQFVVHYDYAYGKMGCPPRIGKETTIIYTIKVVHFLTEESLKDILYMTPSQRNEQSFKAIMEGVRQVREAGNRLYYTASYHKAIREYRNCADILESYWGVKTKAEEDERHEFLCGLFCNMAAAYLKLEKGPQACNACKNALRYKVDSFLSRIYILSGRAQGAVGSYDEAIRLLDKALRIGEHPSDCRKYKAEMTARKQQDESRRKEMCKLMMGMNESNNSEKERVKGKEAAAVASGSASVSVSKEADLGNESRATGLAVRSATSTISSGGFEADTEGEYSSDNVGRVGPRSGFAGASASSAHTMEGSSTSDKNMVEGVAGAAGGNVGNNVSATCVGLTQDSVTPTVSLGGYSGSYKTKEAPEIEIVGHDVSGSFVGLTLTQDKI